MADNIEGLLRLFIDQAPVAIAMFDREMRYIAASRRWLSDYGLAERDLRGLSHYDVFPDLPDRWREVHRRGLDGEIVTANEDRFDRADGKVQWLHWEVRPWYGTAGIGGIIIFAEEITERKRAQERFRIVVESNPTANVLVDERGLIVLVNRQAEQLFGYSRAELLGRPIEMLVPRHLQTVHAEHSARFLEAPRARSMGVGRDLFALCRDGQVVPVEIGLAPIESEGGPLILASIIDITERKQARERILELNAELEQRVRERTAQLEESVANLQQALQMAEALRKELREQAIRDPLTGLFNRRFLEETLNHDVARAIRTRSPLGVVMFDIDNFKNLNDTFGHAAGDAVLREVGQLVVAHIRAADVACRYGGDEFILVMPDTSIENAIRKANQLREQLKRVGLELRDVKLPEVEFSMGVAVFPNHGASGVELLKSVDAALYRAKQEGGGRVIAAG
jgi:diguanylate cyclase (GGDEF)-like protein/PAS domain S-box-containing protein